MVKSMKSFSCLRITYKKNSIVIYTLIFYVTPFTLVWNIRNTHSGLLIKNTKHLFDRVNYFYGISQHSFYVRKCNILVVNFVVNCFEKDFYFYLLDMYSKLNLTRKSGFENAFCENSCYCMMKHSSFLIEF